MKTIELSNQSFSKTDAITIATRVVDLKIRNYEDQITGSDNEEDIKMKESAIKRLQTHLQNVREEIGSGQKEILISYNLVIR